MKKLLPLLLVAAGIAIYWFVNRPPSELVLTGIVTTHEVVVSPQIAGPDRAAAGQRGRHRRQGRSCWPSWRPDELREDRAFYGASAEGAGAQVAQSEAALRLEGAAGRRADRPGRGDAGRDRRPGARPARPSCAARALEVRAGAGDVDQRHRHGAAARAGALRLRGRQVAAWRRWPRRSTPQRATVEPGPRQRSSEIAIRRTQLRRDAARSGPRPTRSAPRPTSASPTPRCARRSTASSTRGPRARARSSTPGGAVLTLIDPDDLWVRADVEETYIDRVKLGDTLKVRLPSGAEREGTVVLPRRRRRLRHAARRQPHQARHPDLRDPPEASTTPTAGSPIGMTAYVLLPVGKVS